MDNNFFDNNGKMIKKIKNDLGKRNINNLNNINEERFYNTASKPNKNKIKIEHKKRIPNNIKEKNIIKNIFPQINNYDDLQQSVLLHLRYFTMLINNIKILILLSFNLTKIKILIFSKTGLVELNR